MLSLQFVRMHAAAVLLANSEPLHLALLCLQGIVSGVGRELSTGLSSIKNVIQTDAAINPGKH